MTNILAQLDDLDWTRQQLLDLLTERAFSRRQVTLASGRISNFYLDCKKASLEAEGHLYIGALYLDEIRQYEARTGVTVVGVGGLTMGADPLASAVAMISALKGSPLPAFLVRKEAKGHGTKQYLEGAYSLPEKGEVVILEDVVTTGGSALKAVERVRAAGYMVNLVLGLVDRLEGGRENTEAADVELRTLFTRRDFMEDE